MLFKYIVAISLISQISACSIFTSQPAPKKTIKMEFSEPNRIQFQGKGAGAGIALMGVMGPMGISLGVAIDEGIAKDIRKAIAKEVGNIDAFLLAELDRNLAANDVKIVAQSSASKYPILKIKKIGFKIINGSTDATSAEWRIELTTALGKTTTVNYPNDFDKSTIKTYVLAALKVDGKLGAGLLRESLKKVLTEGAFAF
ncbi:MAG: hypothetical protein RPS47_11360 [Colwellia sp.]